MSVIGVRDPQALPSVWAEARSTATLHNERTNIPQVITRSEADAISHNVTGPIRRTTHEVPQVAARDVTMPGPELERFPELNRQNYSALAHNQSNYRPYDYLSYNYNLAGRGLYTPNPNPVIINKII